MPAEFLTTTGFLFEFGRELLVLNSLKIRELKRKAMIEEESESARFRIPPRAGKGNGWTKAYRHYTYATMIIS